MAPRFRRGSRRRAACSVLLALGIAAAAVLPGCDTVAPEADAQLVVEAFLDAGEPLPPLILRQSQDRAAAPPVEAAIREAEVAVVLEGQQVLYAPVPDRPGYFAPATALSVPAGAAFSVQVVWRDQVGRAAGVIPPALQIDSVSVRIPAVPVEAVLIDSLGGTAQRGFIYPIEVTCWWDAPPGATTPSWVRAQLQPVPAFSSRVVDLILRTEQVVLESDLGLDAQGRRNWTGVYAVPVAAADTPVPEHRLRVAVLRSDAAYARYAMSRADPGQREPVGNVEGALGIVAGIALDSLNLVVPTGRPPALP